MRIPAIDYKKMHNWENYSFDLPVEYRQSIEEGKDLSAYKSLFEAVAGMEKSEEKARIADVLYSLVMNAKTVEGYAYNEPDELDEIRALSEGNACACEKLSEEALFDRVYGAWLGRICGCLLGKTVEGIRTNELHALLKESGNFPMHRYILSGDVTEEMKNNFVFPLAERCYADKIDAAPVDDDTNYVVLAQVLIEKYGRDFTSENVERVWLDYQPKYAYCTAERVAYVNFVKGYHPHDSALYKNPYREWIGAQIRGDYFGYINPGNPALAAEMAWRDARISHVKNGIYGEMFASAMIAAAACESDIKKIIRAGLNEIPQTSRLHEAVSRIICDFENGADTDAAFKAIHTRWDEHNSHDWCHTISNAEIVAASLLYGNGDFGKSICLAVQTGFDTDCNGATVGSVLGMRGGAKVIDNQWSDPVNGLLDTSIFGVGRVNIRDMAEKTLSHIENA